MHSSVLISNWLRETSVPGGLWPQTRQLLFSTTANAKILLSCRHLLSGLGPGWRFFFPQPPSKLCCASAVNFFSPGCAILSGGRHRRNHYRCIHFREEISAASRVLCRANNVDLRWEPRGHELTNKCRYSDSLSTTTFPWLSRLQVSEPSWEVRLWRSLNMRVF